ncbi:hypothetical protein DFH09DRAFT_1370166 [Mycena vulgaris]|nr:hypothetical protein DFH09DRAFT_1370166 [Mycena vulgaris]
MRSFTVILSVLAAVLAAPRALVPRAVVPLAVICTDVDFAGSCVTIVSPAPFESAHPIGCAPMTAPFTPGAKTDAPGCQQTLLELKLCDHRERWAQRRARLRGVFELNCGGTRLVVSGKIPDFRAAAVNFNDKALSWNCGSALTSV